MKSILYFLAFLFLLPTKTTAQWEQTAGPRGGDVQDLLRHEGKLWAATSGGLYFSPNEADHWECHPDIEREYVVFDLEEHNGMLFAFARAFQSGWNDYRFLIYRSDDDGETWANISEIPFGYTFDYRLASIKGKLFLIDAGKVFCSVDNGLTWAGQSLPFQLGDFRYDSVTVTWRSYSEGVFVSQDGMDTWQQIADSSENFGDVHVVKGNVIIAERYFPVGGFRCIISHDLGQTWDSMPEPPNPANYGPYFYNGGGDTILGITDKIYWTTDFGANWQLWGSTSGGIFPRILTPYGAIGSNNYQTIWKYRHSTGVWERADKGLTASYTGELKTNSNILFAKTSSGFYGSQNAGQNWTEISLPIGAASSDLFDVSGDTLYWGAYRTLYVATGNGSSGWDTLASYIGNSYPDDVSVQGDKIVWVGSYDDIFLIGRTTGDIDTLALPDDADDFNHFLRIIGSRYVYTDNNGDAYISDNQGISWTKTLEQGNPGNNSGNQLFYLLGRLFLCTRDGMNISADNGATWSSPATMPQLQFEIDGMTSAGDLLFFTAPYIGVYISIDFGQNWQPYNTGLGCFYGVSMAALNGQIFLGTFGSGVWRRTNDLSLLTGNVYFDDDNDGIRDWDEAPAPDVILRTSPSDLFCISQFDGTYSAYANVAADTLHVVPFTPYATVNPPYYVGNQSGATGLDFGVHIIPGIKDLEVVLTNTQPFVPGFYTDVVITCRNVGTVAQEPVLAVLFDSTRMYFSNAVPAPDSFVDFHTFFWKLPLLDPFKSINIKAAVGTWSSIPLGDTVTVAATIFPENGDETPLNNHDLLREVVVGSYDPNDKQVSPGENISPAQIAAGERLTYTIRFQNTGTYPATFVRIVDTLSQQFDIGSLQILTASHPFTWSLRSANVLEFYFENINLPDSSNNEPGSHGFVKYSIRPKQNLLLGTPLPNTAYIFFDFNAPVVTNTTQTTVAWPTRTSEPSLSQPLQIMPNPASTLVHIQRSSGKPGTVVLRDANGRTLLSKSIDGQMITLPVYDLPQGVYQISVQEKDGVQSGVLLIQR